MGSNSRPNRQGTVLKEALPAGLREKISSLMGSSIETVAKCHGGRNNQVYRVKLSDGRKVVVKKYAPIDSLGRDRRKTEYDAITFLFRHGVRSIPVPLGTDPELNIALYSYVAADHLRTGDINEQLIDSIGEFYGNLRTLGSRPGAERFDNASEAFFHGSAIVDNLSARLDRLDRLKDCGKAIGALHDFVSLELRPSVTRAIASAVDLDRSLFDCALPGRWRMLSPSDVGFHNILRDRSSQLVFLDFEYFGWDDPAKLISDFLTQHDFELPLAMGTRFLALMLDVCGEDTKLPQRLKIYFPIFRAKKAMIALNEFVPGEAARREASTGVRVDDELLNRQLTVARNVMSRALPAT